MGGKLYDLVVIGGGINGAGIAADAAGRGLSVLLVEMNDLASATSSASSKLVHGGLRYLEHYAFRLVREALAEREVMLARAPHIVRPLRFVLPETPGMRSRLVLRAGLFLYDHLARRRRLPGSAAIDLRSEACAGALRPGLRHGFAYWDCWVDDARLVVLNARLAAGRGADVRTRTKVVALSSGADRWTVTLNADGERETCAARVVVNAAGPWADRVAARIRGVPGGGGPCLRLVKGGHIVVPRIAAAGDALLLQNDDGRVVFVLPFENAFSLIGTTEVPFTGDPADVACSPDEEAYLLGAANRFLARPLTPADIVWRFAGVRPLLADDAIADPSALSRDYSLDARGERHGAAILTVLGGKVTTFRRLAEDVMQRVGFLFPGLRPAWTAVACLPGGEMPDGDFDAFLTSVARRYGWLPEPLRTALARRHGTLIGDVIGDARRVEDLGSDLGGGLTEREVRYLARNEWARAPEDILWRRTKAGLALLQAPPSARAAAADRIAALL